MNSGLTIRRARANDADDIARLWQLLVTYHRELDPDLPPPTVQGAERYGKRVRDHMDNPLACVLVAVNDEEVVVGYVLGMIVDLAPEMFAQEPSGFLADIMVDETYRRQGIGQALVEALVGWFNQQGVRYFEWHASAHNETGLRFWQAMGGRTVMLRMRTDLRE